jgi:hypothetical protein
MPELWSAILNSSGPNYDTWFPVFGEHRVPLIAPQAIKANLGEERDVEVYLLNLRAMTLGQRARLLAAMAQKFRVPVYEVEQEIERSGFPIRAVDVIVTFDTRAFV